MSRNYKHAIKNEKLKAEKLMTKQQFRQANAIIHTASLLSAASVAFPNPILHMPHSPDLPINKMHKDAFLRIPKISNAAQITMVIALGEIFNQKISSVAAKSLIVSSSSIIIESIFIDMIDKIPGIGFRISGAVTGLITEAIGWTVAVNMAHKFNPPKNYAEETSRI